MTCFSRCVIVSGGALNTSPASVLGSASLSGAAGAVAATAAVSSTNCATWRRRRRVTSCINGLLFARVVDRRVALAGRLAAARWRRGMVRVTPSGSTRRGNFVTRFWRNQSWRICLGPAIVLEQPDPEPPRQQNRRKKTPNPRMRREIEEPIPVAYRPFGGPASGRLAHSGARRCGCFPGRQWWLDRHLPGCPLRTGAGRVVFVCELAELGLERLQERPVVLGRRCG